MRGRELFLWLVPRIRTDGCNRCRQHTPKSTNPASFPAGCALEVLKHVGRKTASRDFVLDARWGCQPTKTDLRREWPAAFNDRRLPLKIGIHADLGLEYPNAAIGLWVRHPLYLRAIISGTERIDLDGNPAGVITAEQKLIAFDKLMWMRADIASSTSSNRKFLTGLSAEDEIIEQRKRMPKKPEVAS
jgi:hypothetical protein